MQKTHCFLRQVMAFALIFAAISHAHAVSNGVQTNLPIQQHFITEADGMVQTEPSATYELAAMQPSNPMPKGSQDGIYQFTLTGIDTTLSLPLWFDHAGTYGYTLRPISVFPADSSPDQHCYQIYVSVQNGPDGALSIQMIAQHSQEAKSNTILFAHHLHGNPAALSPQTGDFAPMLLWWICLPLSVGFLFLHRRRSTTL